MLSYQIKPENESFRALSYYILWFMAKLSVFDFDYCLFMFFALFLPPYYLFIISF